MIVTHSGRFHADEVFALAMLKFLPEFQNLEVLRSREANDIEKAEIVLDVGGDYNHQSKRYDHHQNSFTEQRQNGIPFATAGIIWRHYAPEIFKQLGLQADNEIQFAVEWLDAKLIEDLDAVDNGVYSDDPRPSVSLLVAMMNESSDEPEKQQIAFDKAVDFAKDILKNFIDAAIKQAQVVTELEARLDTLENGIWVLDSKAPFKDFIQNRSEIQRVVYPRNEEQFGVYCNGKENHLPERFRGLREGELSKVSDLEDAVFCHKSGFMAVTLSKESALVLAKSS